MNDHNRGGICWRPTQSWFVVICVLSGIILHNNASSQSHGTTAVSYYQLIKLGDSTYAGAYTSQELTVGLDISPNPDHDYQGYAIIDLSNLSGSATIKRVDLSAKMYADTANISIHNAGNGAVLLDLEALWSSCNASNVIDEISFKKETLTDRTYSAGTGFIDILNNAKGDTAIVGIKLLFPIDTTRWFNSANNLNLVVYYDTVIAISVDAAVSDSGAYSNIRVRTDDNSYKMPPYEDEWKTGEQHMVELWNDYYVENGYRKKHVDWNSSAVRYSVKIVENDYDGDIANYVSYWAEIVDFDVEGSFDQQNGGNYKFGLLDPWRVLQEGDSSQSQLDMWVKLSVPYSAAYDTSSFGMFVDKYPLGDDPHYRIAIPKRLDSSREAYDIVGANLQGDYVLYGTVINGNDYDVYELSSNGPADTLAIVLKGQHDGPIIINYKAHRLSKSSVGLSPSENANMRRVEFDLDEHLHSVYESGGEIWYMMSIDSGATWQSEVRLSSGEGAAKHPCLDVYPDLEANGSYAEIFITFIENDSLVLMTSMIAGQPGIWERQALAQVENPESTPSIGIQRPCGAAANETTGIIVYNESNALKCIRMIMDSIVAGPETLRIPSNRIGYRRYYAPKYPAVTQDLMVAWIDLGEGYVMSHAAQCEDPGTVTYENIYRLQTGMVDEPISLSSDLHQIVAVTTACRPVNMTCAAYINTRNIGTLPTFYPSHNRVVVYHRNNSYLNNQQGWLPDIVLHSAYQVSNPNLAIHPSISKHTDKNSAGHRPVRIAVNMPNMGIRVYQFDQMDTSSFIAVAQTDGYNPNVAANWRQGFFSNIELFSEAATSPYDCKVSFTEKKLNKSTTEQAYSIVREYIVRRDSAVGKIGVKDPIVTDGAVLKYLTCPDSAVYDNNVELKNKMRTEPFLIAESSTLSFVVGGYFLNTTEFGENARFAIVVMSEMSDDTLYKKYYNFIDSCIDSLVLDSVSVDLSQHCGVEAYLTVLQEGLEDSTEYFFRDVIMLDEATAKQAGQNFDRNRQANVEFINVYPNPPGNTVNIIYKTVQDEYVDIEIRDLFGRVVLEKSVSDFRAGERSISINLDSLTKGAYLIVIKTLNSFDASKIIIVE